MKIFLSILGYFIGVFLGMAILAMLTAASNSDHMKSSFIFGNITGIICAIFGYNLPKKKNL